jgi:pimeloyl-ACP methyl ester carboxylesterase
MENDIIIDGMKLHYEVTGPSDGSPVLLMHGWGCSHDTVKSIANMLNRDMLVYNIDLPGHGSSQEPPEAWGVEAYTSLMEKFIARLNLSDPVLIGHSFGGRIAILLSSRNPISRMVLVDAAGIKPKRPLKYYIKVYSFKTAKKILPLIFGKSRGTKIIEAWRGKAGSADYRNSSPMMRAVMSRCVNEDLTDRLPLIKASTLLLWGNDDKATPLSDAKTMERLIPDAGLVSWSDCGHYSFLDNPGAFRAVIRNFLIKS